MTNQPWHPKLENQVRVPVCTENIIRISLDTVTNREIYFDQLIKIDDEMPLS